MFQAGSRSRFWLIFSIAAVAVLWLLKPVLLPFVVGLAIAYFLDPVVSALARRRVPRWLAALGILIGFFLIIGIFGTLIGPPLKEQIVALINAMPGYVENMRNHFLPIIDGWIARFSPDDMEKIRGAAGQYADNAAGLVGKALGGILSGGMAIIDIAALFVIMPVVAFYLLRDWPALKTTVDSLLPRRYYETISEQLREIDRTLAGFLRGQALVCLCLGIIYGGGLMLAGLHYSVAIGMVAGVLSFIPYVGTFFAWISSLIVALSQFDSISQIGAVVGVLVFGQVVETYLLTPRLVGERVKLHPVWILFALIAGAQLMGFAGILIAVPTAAIIGVLARFAVRRYKNSPLYQDPTAPNPP